MKIAGIALLLVGIALFLYAAPKVDQANSLGGQLAIGLSSLTSRDGGAGIAAEVQRYEWMKNGGMVMGAVGLLLSVLGFAGKSPKA
jgi:hypothetical protein